MILDRRYVDYTGTEIVVEPVLGGPMICAALAAMIAGLNINQAFIYFRSWSRDVPLLRNAVAAMTFFQLLHIGMILAGAYIWIIKQYGEITLLDHIPWPAGFQICVTSILILLTQGIFIARISALAKSWLLAAGMGIFVAGQLVLGFYVGSNVIRIAHQANMTYLLYFVYAWEATAAVGDLLITIAMTALLWRMKQSTVYDQTKTIVKRAIMVTFETNFPSAVFCSVTTIVLAVSDSNWGFGLNFIAAQIYPLTVFISLNYRKSLSDTTREVSTGTLNTYNLSGLRSTSQSQPYSTEDQERSTVGVNVNIRKATEVTYDTDHDSSSREKDDVQW